MRLGTALAEAVAPFGGRAYRPGGDEFCVIADAATPARARAGRLPRAVGERRGLRDLDRVRIRGDPAGHGRCHRGHAQGRQGDVRAKALRPRDRRAPEQRRLLRALAERHPDLGDHLDGVTELAERGRPSDSGIDGEELTSCVTPPRLHDIGKVAIPDAIITKPATLSDDEWAFMRRHTMIGERIIAAAPALGAAARLVRSSHEAFDGSGYPDGLAGVEIPLGARIIAVCDAFDAMISERPYSPAKTTAEALAEVRRCAGTQFDPTIVAVFEQVLSDRARLPVA